MPLSPDFPGPYLNTKSAGRSVRRASAGSHCLPRPKLSDSARMMEPHDVQRLRTKRSVLQAGLRRGGADPPAPQKAPPKRAAGVRKLSRLPPSRLPALLAPFRDLPGRDERFHWPDISGGRCMDWHGEEARDELFRRALTDSFAPSARLVLVFHSAEYALVIGRDDAAAQARLLLDACYQSLWVVALTPDGHLVEVAPSDRDICWGANLAPRT